MGIQKVIGLTAGAAGIAAVCCVFVSVASTNHTSGRLIRLAHNQQDGTEIADSIAEFETFVEEEDPSENLSVKIYPSGILGSENEEIEMVKAGILDMAKVSSNTLGQFDDRYSIFAIPYLFQSQEHYYDAMENSKAIQELFNSTADQGFIAIGYYANGARNFYLKENICVDDPSDLAGKKIRSMPLTVNGHEDLVSSYTYTEHQYSPDIYIISTDTWNTLTKKQQQYLKDCLAKTNDNFKAMYNGMMEDAIEEATEHGVTVYKDIDKSAFIEAVQPMHEAFAAKGAAYQALLSDIESCAK